MAQERTILIVDDEQDLLELYQGLLAKIESRPRVLTADSGKRALAFLAAEPIRLLITDLNMPRMDGFQLLTVVRNKYPAVRTVVITGVDDQQFRARAYGMGIDLFLEKPNNEEEIDTFVDCIEGVLEREDAGGFRGFQSMSLVDLIQSECMAGSSCVLKISNGPLTGKIWVDNGEIIESTAQGLNGEEGFRKILEWKAGSFEKLPPEEGRERTIFNSYQGLLLDSAQTLDQAEADDMGVNDEGETLEGGETRSGGLGPISRCEGVEFVLSVERKDAANFDHWAADGAAELAAWAHERMKTFREFGDKLNAGQLNSALGVGLKRHLALLPGNERDLCLGLRRSMSQSEVRSTVEEVTTKWDS